MAGNGGRTGGRNDQWSLGSASGFSSTGDGLPAAIQFRIAAISPGSSGMPIGGIRSAGSLAVTRFSNTEASTAAF